MAQNEHKKVLRQLSEAYQNVISEYSQDERSEDAESALGNLVKGTGRGIGDVAKGVGRLGLAAGGASAAAAGGALGAAMNIARTLTADQLKALGEFALRKSAENEEEDEEPRIDPLPDEHPLSDKSEKKAREFAERKPKPKFTKDEI